ncbi:hypothetical protein Gotri_025292 [Gossypium trilobum]|uniref:Retrotransposon gag domain-containing protein n=1 Tax=Gossypium trilobum TaxID=34281 RepID=A0A7J9FID9_9ROSI|nr:hypothetical protein [Gossypium trilobum]
MATMRALSTRIKELEGELALCRATEDKGVSSATPNCEVDIPKTKELAGKRSCNMDNFLWRMEQYFPTKGIIDNAIKSRPIDKRHSEIKTWEEFQYELKGQLYPEYVKEEAREKLRQLTQRGTIGEYVREFKELIFQISDVNENKAFLTFNNGLKLWVRQELER